MSQYAFGLNDEPVETATVDPALSFGEGDEPLKTGEALPDDEQARMLEYARERLANPSLVDRALYGNPNLSLQSMMMGLGAGVVSPGLRLAGNDTALGPLLKGLGFDADKQADRVNRFADAFRQAASERDQQMGAFGHVTGLVRGAGESLIPSLAGSAAGGSAGAIGTAMIQTGNRAITEGRDAGLDEFDVYKHAIAQATIEGGVASLFQKFGFGGAENVRAGVREVTRGIVQGFRKAGKAATEEAVEEAVTEGLQAAEESLAGVDPEAIKLENVLPRMAYAAELGALVGGATRAPNIAQGAAKGKAAAEKLAKIKEMRAKRFISEEDAAELELDEEQSKSRKTRWDATEALMAEAEKEIQDAQEVLEFAEEARERESSEGVREPGQDEVPTEPTSQVTPAQEVQVEAPQPPTEAPAVEATPEPEVVPEATEEAVEEPVVEQTPLEKAGIDIKPTPKGWSVGGIPEEIINAEGFEGRNLGRGRYRFTADPTEVLTNAAQEIAEEAEAVAAAEASGLVRTRIGTLTPEQAEGYEQERKARIETARQQVDDRNQAIAEAVGHAVPAETRGDFKLALMDVLRRGADHRDAKVETTLGEIFQYLTDHAEQGAILPQDKAELFELLANDNWKQAFDEAAVGRDIDDALATELERFAAEDQGIGDEIDYDDDTWDFGEGEDEWGQTAIPGFEDEAANADQNDERERAKKKLQKPKESQQKLFGTKGRADQMELDEQPKTKLQQAAEKATEQRKQAEAKLGAVLKKHKFTSGIDPEVAGAVYEAVTAYAKEGTLKVSAFLEQLVKTHGKAAIEKLTPTISQQWEKYRKTGEVPDMEPWPKKKAKPKPKAKTETRSKDRPDFIGIKKERLEAQAAAAGQPPPSPAEVVSVVEMMKGAVARHTPKADKAIQERAAEVIAGEFATLEETADLAASVRYHNTEANKADDRYNELMAEGRDDAAKEAAALSDDHRAKERQAAQAARLAGSRQFGQFGNLLQVIIDKDGEAEIERILVKANNGEPIDQGFVKKWTKEIAAIKKKLEKRGKEIEEETSNEAAEERIRELEKELKQEQARNKVRKPRARGAKNRVVTQEKYDAAKERIKRRLTQSRLSANPADIVVASAADLAVMATFHIEAGARKFADFARTMKSELGDWVEPHLEDLHRKARADWAKEQGKKLRDRLAKAENPRAQHRNLSALAKEILAETRQEDGTFISRDELLTKLHEEMQAIDENITLREVRDMLSGYGKYEEISQEELEVTYRNYRGESRVLSQKEDLLAKMVAKRTGREQHTPSLEERQLAREVRELKKQGEREGWYTEGDKANRLKGQLEAQKTRLRNEIEDLNRDIASLIAGQPLSTTQKTEPLTDDALEDLRKERNARKAELTRLDDPDGGKAYLKLLERRINQLKLKNKRGDVWRKQRTARPGGIKIDAAKAEIEALEAQRDAIREAQKPGYKDALAMKASIAHIKTNTAKVAARIAAGKFAPQKRKPPRAWDDPAWQAAKADELAKRKELAEKTAEYEYEHMTRWDMTRFGARRVKAVWKAIMTGFDQTALGLQGGPTMFTNPVVWAKALVPTARAGFSVKKRELQDAARQSHPDYERYTNYGLVMMEHGAGKDMASVEFYGNDSLIDRIPGVAVSERTFTTFLNELRFNLMQVMEWAYTKDGRQLSGEQGKALATMVNTFTLAYKPEHHTSQAVLNAAGNFFWAPSMYVARAQLAMGAPVLSPFSGADSRVRMIAAKQYVKLAVGTAALLAVGRMLLGDDEDDDLTWTDTDFWKVKSGNIRMDVTSGVGQMYTLAARSLASTLRGLMEEPPAWTDTGRPVGTRDLLGSFASFKTAPWVSALFDLTSEKDVLGRPTSVANMALSNMTPLSVQTVIEAVEETNLPQGLMWSIPGVTGRNLSIYDRSAPKSEETFLATTRRLGKRSIGQEPAGLADDKLAPYLRYKLKYDTDLDDAGKFLTPKQLEAAKTFRDYKRGLIVYNAGYHGDSVSELGTRDKAREHLKAMGVSSYDEAKEMMRVYYRFEAEEGWPGKKDAMSVKSQGWKDRLAELRKLFQ